MLTISLPAENTSPEGVRFRRELKNTYYSAGRPDGPDSQEGNSKYAFAIALRTIIELAMAKFVRGKKSNRDKVGNLNSDGGVNQYRVHVCCGRFRYSLVYDRAELTVQFRRLI